MSLKSKYISILVCWVLSSITQYIDSLFFAVSFKVYVLIPSIKISNDNSNNDIKYENLKLDIDRNNLVKEDETIYRNNLENLVNFRDNLDDIDKEKELDKVENLSNDEDIISNSEVLEYDDDSNKLPELYPVGLLLGTYIVCENEKGIYLIDQHAAKERVNYEKISYLLSHPNNDTITPLVPIVIELPMNEYLILKENIDIIEKLNIKIEEFGTSSFRVLSHPTWFIRGREEDIVRQIIDLILKKEKNFSLEKFNDNLAKMVSCKMSIKANTYIDKPSMEALINDLRKCKNPYNCPHGRPSIIHFSIYELEKMFKRSI